MKEVYYSVLFKDKVGYINRVSEIRSKYNLGDEWDDESIVTLGLLVLLDPRFKISPMADKLTDNMSEED